MILLQQNAINIRAIGKDDVIKLPAERDGHDIANRHTHVASLVAILWDIAQTTSNL
jgi:hypothetical protein